MRRLVWIGLSCACLVLPCTGLAAGDDQDLTPPASQPALVEFPGTKPVTIPTRFDHGGVYVRVTIAKRDFYFELDSGASSITLDPDVAHQLGLTLGNHTINPENAHAADMSASTVPEMKIGPLTMHDVPVTVISMSGLQGPFIKPVGLLGFDFFAHVGVTVDYEHQRVTVAPLAGYVPPADPHAVPVEIRLGDQVPMVDVELDNALASRFIIDTGDTQGTFTVFNYFTAKNPNVGYRSAEVVGAIGIGGYVEDRSFGVHSFRIGAINFVNFTGTRVGPDSYPGPEDGLIGAAFLDLFTLDFDYPHRMLYLTPNTLTKQLLHIH
jgi:hypothetical protein